MKKQTVWSQHQFYPNKGLLLCCNGRFYGVTYDNVCNLFTSFMKYFIPDAKYKSQRDVSSQCLFVGVLMCVCVGCILLSLSDLPLRLFTNYFSFLHPIPPGFLSFPISRPLSLSISRKGQQNFLSCWSTEKKKRANVILS